jgi:hypothetical protein
MPYLSVRFLSASLFGNNLNYFSHTTQAQIRFLRLSKG